MFGILLGAAVAAGALHAIPVVDQHREVSYVSVAPNGGNLEEFHINMPVDRVMLGSPGQASGFPAGMEWPEDDILSTFGAEIFKVRNSRDVVIGVAARAHAQEPGDDVIDWVLHLPARGSLFINMNTAAVEGGGRVGQIRAGTREFQSMSGFIAERWVADTSDEEDSPDGRIELLATYVGEQEPAQ